MRAMSTRTLTQAEDKEDRATVRSAHLNNAEEGT